VKIEGDFFLRYRVFDLFSFTAGLVDVPVLTECGGGSFHIYSTKEFPGLQPSTALSKVTWDLIEHVLIDSLGSNSPDLAYDSIPARRSASARERVMKEALLLTQAQTAEGMLLQNEKYYDCFPFSSSASLLVMLHFLLQ
jgi:hypothetical protein